MSATELKLRRGTGPQCEGMTRVLGEPIFDTTANRLRLGDNSRAGGFQVPNFKDLQNDSLTLASAVGGTATAISLTFSVPTLSDGNGQKIEWVPTSDAAGATTVANDGRGAVTVKKWKSGTLVDIEANDWKSGQRQRAYSNGTYYILDRTDFGSGITPGMKLLATATPSGAASADFTGYITSDYNAYMWIFENLTHTNGVVDTLLARVRRAGQGSYDSGSSDYATAGVRMNGTVAALSS